MAAKILGAMITNIKIALHNIWLALSKVFIFLGRLSLATEKAEDLRPRQLNCKMREWENMIGYCLSK